MAARLIITLTLAATSIAALAGCGTNASPSAAGTPSTPYPAFANYPAMRPMPKGAISHCGFADVVQLPGDVPRSTTSCAGIGGYVHPWQAPQVEVHLGAVINLTDFISGFATNNPKVLALDVRRPAKVMGADGTATAMSLGSATLDAVWPSCLNGNAYGRCTILRIDVVP